MLSGSPKILTVHAKAMSSKDRKKTTGVVETTLPSTATFEVVLNHLNDLFSVTDGKQIRVGAQSNEPVGTFKGLDLGSYLKMAKVYPCRLNLTLVSDEKFAEFTSEEEDEDVTPPKPTKSGVKRKKKQGTGSSKKVADTPPESSELDIKEVQRDKEIGRGATAVVFSGKWRNNDVAVKVCSVPTPAMAKMLANVINSEIKIHMSVAHHNVLTMFGFSRAQKEVSMVMELMDVSLRDLLSPDDESSPTTLTDEQKTFITKEMTRYENFQ